MTTTADHASYQVNDGTFTVGGTLTTESTSISVSHDGVVQLAAVGGSGNLSLTVDGTSSLEIGTAGGAAAGSITIDAGLDGDNHRHLYGAAHHRQWHRSTSPRAALR